MSINKAVESPVSKRVHFLSDVHRLRYERERDEAIERYRQTPREFLPDLRTEYRKVLLRIAAIGALACVAGMALYLSTNKVGWLTVPLVVAPVLFLVLVRGWERLGCYCPTRDQFATDIQSSSDAEAGFQRLVRQQLVEVESVLVANQLPKDDAAAIALLYVANHRCGLRELPEPEASQYGKVYSEDRAIRAERYHQLMLMPTNRDSAPDYYGEHGFRQTYSLSYLLDLQKATRGSATTAGTFDHITQSRYKLNHRGSRIGYEFYRIEHTLWRAQNTTDA